MTALLALLANIAYYPLRNAVTSEASSASID